MSVAPAAARVRALTAGELAWVAALPCAALILFAIFVLAPPLGHALPQPPPDQTLWPRQAPYVFGHPEPVKHVRVAFALLGPVLLAGVLLALGRRRVVLRPGVARAMTVTVWTSIVVLFVGAFLGQNNLIFPETPRRAEMYGLTPILVGAALPALLLALVRRPVATRLIARFARETRARRIACFALAALLAATWLLTAVDTEGTVGHAQFGLLPPWAMSDALAIMDGRTPLVNFYPLYGELWAYVAAIPMRILGPNVLVFSLTMTTISALAVVAIYDVFRRIVRSPVAAILLFAPFVATSFFALHSHGFNIGSNAEVFSVWPMRYAGPCVMAWLTARHLDGAAPRRRWLLFLVAGLVVLNNVEFGIAAFGATVVALVCVRPPRSRAAVARAARDVAAGLLLALAAVSALTLVRGGALPHLGDLLEYPRLFGLGGFVSVAILVMGFHLVVYVTFVAAIATAVVRVVKRDPGGLLTGMLAWSGTFGLIASDYFAGRSDSLKLTSLFSAWALALALLLVVVVRDLAARRARWPTFPEYLVLAGFGLAVTALAQFPTPWSQAARLRQTTPTPIYAETAAKRFVGAETARGEKVAILIPMAHRIAYDLGIVDVSPYALIEALATRRQWRLLVGAMRREGAHKLFLPDNLVVAQQRALLARDGFSRRATRSGYSEWVDGGAG